MARDRAADLERDRRRPGRRKRRRSPPIPRAWGDVMSAARRRRPAIISAVVVDDALQGVTHVVRGQDLFWSTSVHRLLQALLGLPAPTLPPPPADSRCRRPEALQVDAATGLRELRAQGSPPPTSAAWSSWDRSRTTTRNRPVAGRRNRNPIAVATAAAGRNCAPARYCAVVVRERVSSRVRALQAWVAPPARSLRALAHSSLGNSANSPIPAHRFFLAAAPGGCRQAAGTPPSLNSPIPAAASANTTAKTTSPSCNTSDREPLRSRTNCRGLIWPCGTTQILPLRSVLLRVVDGRPHVTVKAALAVAAFRPPWQGRDGLGHAKDHKSSCQRPS